MRKLTDFHIGEYGEYIHDYLIVGQTFHQVPIPASVGLAMVCGLVAAYQQLGFHEDVRARAMSCSLPRLDSEQVYALAGAGPNDGIQADKLAVAEVKVPDLANKGFVCVGSGLYTKAFVYKHDWIWYLYTVRA